MHAHRQRKGPLVLLPFSYQKGRTIDAVVLESFTNFWALILGHEIEGRFQASHIAKMAHPRAPSPEDTRGHQLAIEFNIESCLRVSCYS